MIEKTPKLFFDTDIGSDVDDALALTFLVNSQESNLKGISTVYGPTEIRAKAASTLLNALGEKDIDVLSGATKGMTPGINIWTTGNEGYLVDLKSKVLNRNVSDYYLAQNNFNLLATGPLTNIANLVRHQPFRNQCSNLVIMGGSIAPNSTIPRIEHNFGSDPVAAKQVFESDIDINLIPADLTLKYKLSDDDQNRIHNTQTEAGKLLSAWMRQWREDTRKFPKDIPFFDAVYLHDPIAAAYFIYPEMFSFRKMLLEVGDEGEVYTRRGRAINVCVGIDNVLPDLIIKKILE